MRLWLDADDKEISRPYSIGPHINATDEQLAAHGIRAVEAPDCPRKYWLPFDGERFPEMSQAEKDAVDAAAAQAQADAQAAAQAAHEAWLQTVEVYERVIEAPSVIVHSVASRKGVGIAATDDGELVPYIAHESPYDHAAAEARKLAAVQAANARKAQRATDATAAKGAGSAAAAANSVPALRAEVARLAAIVERLCQ